MDATATNATALGELIEEGYSRQFANDPIGFARGVKREIDTRGIAMLPNFFTPDTLQRMRDEVHGYRARQLGGVRPLIGEQLQGSAFHEFAESDFVHRLSNGILQPFGYSVEKNDTHALLNILEGANRVNVYHFDATFITFAAPVFMPSSESANSGPFRIWPNVRNFSTNWLKTKCFSRVMTRPWLRDRFRQVSVNFQPGNLYLFYGYRSWHGVGEYDGTQLRANCLINVGGPAFYRAKKQQTPEY